MPMWIVTVENPEKERGISFLVNRYPGSAHSAEVSIDSDVPFDRTLAEFLVGVDNSDVCVLRSMMRGLAADLGYEDDEDEADEDGGGADLFAKSNQDSDSDEDGEDAK